MKAVRHRHRDFRRHLSNLERLLSSPNPARILSEPELVRAGVASLGTLANWRSAGIGPPFIRLGSGIGYPLSGLRDWIEAGGTRSHRAPKAAA